MRTFFCIILLCLLNPATALILESGGDGTNETPPVDDPGFDHATNNAVYLGNRWVLAPAHTGAHAVGFGGIGYFPIPGTDFQLSNPDTGKSALTDLILYQVDNDPGLDRLTIADQPPMVGEQVVVISVGKPRNGPRLFWDAAFNPTTEGSAVHSGYAWAGSGSFGKRWGTNEVSLETQYQEIGGVDIAVFETVFDMPSGKALDDECQAAAGDSGGAAFVMRDGQWQLVGVIIALDDINGQPASTAVYGNSTLYADLTVYRDQIVGTVPVTLQTFSVE